MYKLSKAPPHQHHPWASWKRPPASINSDIMLGPVSPFWDNFHWKVDTAKPRSVHLSLQVRIWWTWTSIKKIQAKQQSSIQFLNFWQRRLKSGFTVPAKHTGPCFPFAMNNHVYPFHLGHPTGAHPPAFVPYPRQQREASGIGFMKMNGPVLPDFPKLSSLYWPFKLLLPTLAALDPPKLKACISFSQFYSNIILLAVVGH